MHIFRPIFDSHVQEIWKPSNFWPRAAKEGLYFFLSNGYTTTRPLVFFFFLTADAKFFVDGKPNTNGPFTVKSRTIFYDGVGNSSFDLFLRTFITFVCDMSAALRYE